MFVFSYFIQPKLYTTQLKLDLILIITISQCFYYVLTKMYENIWLDREASPKEIGHCLYYSHTVLCVH